MSNARTDYKETKFFVKNASQRQRANARSEYASANRRLQNHVCASEYEEYVISEDDEHHYYYCSSDPDYHRYFLPERRWSA